MQCIRFGYFYSASTSPLLPRLQRWFCVGVNTPKRYRQLWVKDLPKVLGLPCFLAPGTVWSLSPGNFLPSSCCYRSRIASSFWSCWADLVPLLLFPIPIHLFALKSMTLWGSFLCISSQMLRFFLSFMPIGLCFTLGSYLFRIMYIICDTIHEKVPSLSSQFRQKRAWKEVG